MGGGLLIGVASAGAVREWWAWMRLVQATQHNDVAGVRGWCRGVRDIDDLIPLGVHRVGQRLRDVAAGSSDVATLEELRRDGVRFDRIGESGMLPAALAIEARREPAVIAWLLERVRESSVDNDDNLGVALRAAVFWAADGGNAALPGRVLDLYKSSESLRRDLSDTLGDAVEYAPMKESVVRSLAGRGVELEYRRSPGDKTLRERAEARGRLAWLAERR